MFMSQIRVRPSAWGPPTMNAPDFGDGSILKGKFTFQSREIRFPWILIVLLFVQNHKVCY